MSAHGPFPAILTDFHSHTNESVGISNLLLFNSPEVVSDATKGAEHLFAWRQVRLQSASPKSSFFRWVYSCTSSVFAKLGFPAVLSANGLKSITSRISLTNSSFALMK